MLYEPHTCIDHKQDITPFYDVDGYGRCYSNMLCIGYFFLFLLAVVLLTEAGGQALKIGSDQTTPKSLSHNLLLL